ncbi:hypothetical protein DL93DRAFT_1972109 [Clavulina sp. PMI_390]|nr:hypothetical protein DL93DRAFT_1972109 [Clavulina sp. PMI_390]
MDNESTALPMTSNTSQAIRDSDLSSLSSSNASQPPSPMAPQRHFSTRSVPPAVPPTFLPPEIQSRLLLEVDWEQLFWLRLVCRFWKHTIDGTVATYKVWLGANSKVNGSRRASEDDKLLQLMQHETRWATLQPATVDRNIISHGMKDSQLFLSGPGGGAILVNPERKNFATVGMIGSVLSSTESTFKQSIELNFPLHHWEWTLHDQSKDLLIIRLVLPFFPLRTWLLNTWLVVPSSRYLKWEMRKLSCPTEFHPDSLLQVFDAQPILPTPGMTDHGTLVTLVGDWVLTVITGLIQNYSTIFAWDWMTGEIMFNLVVPKSFIDRLGGYSSEVYYHVEHITLLDSNTFVLPVAYRAPGASSHCEALQVYQFRQQATSDSFMDTTDAPVPELVRTFALPQSYVQPGVKQTIQVHAAPVFDQGTPRDRRRQWRKQHQASKPFLELDATRLFTISFKTEGARPRDQTYLFVIPTNVLLSAALDGAATARGPGSMKVIPWEAWGHKNAACLLGDRFSHPKTWATYGDRIAVLEKVTPLQTPPSSPSSTRRDSLAPSVISLTSLATLSQDELPSRTSVETAADEIDSLVDFSPSSPPKSRNSIRKALQNLSFSRRSTSYTKGVSAAISPLENVVEVDDPTPEPWRLAVLDFNQARVNRLLHGEHSFPVNSAPAFKFAKSTRPGDRHIVQGGKQLWVDPNTVPPVSDNRRQSTDRQMAIYMKWQNELEWANEDAAWGPAYKGPIYRGLDGGFGISGGGGGVGGLKYIEAVYWQDILVCKAPKVEMDEERIVLTYVSRPCMFACGKSISSLDFSHS